ncbi:MAG TPA: DUF1499 domain-containing protein [Burkholderiaceae bacterium]
MIATLIVLVAAAAGLLLAGRAGLFAGRAPADLGVRDGRLKPPSATDNSVSSQAGLYKGEAAVRATIDPFRYRGPAGDALARIRRVIESLPRTRVIEQRADYLYAQFTTRWLGFVDDVEFYAPDSGKVIHVRSASRLGSKDYGVNRLRIESIRQLFEVA